jgi:pyruvate/2-oxoglutarate dehydrogenase complex dihydrolipoamide acyltransferase (E2) component
MTNIVLPELGEGITKATVACWHAKPGDVVQAGDDLLEVVTDKATFNIEAPSAGRLSAIVISEGKEGLVGQVLGTIEAV